MRLEKLVPRCALDRHPRGTSLQRTMQHQNGDSGDTSQVWKTAPVLIGTTKFEPRDGVRNIMVTGGAGFM